MYRQVIFLILLTFLTPIAYADDPIVVSSPPVCAKDEGSTIGCPVFSIDCSGAGISCSKTGSELTLSVAAAAGGGEDAVQVNGVAVDTTADFIDSIYIEWGLADGGAGGPDDVTAKADYDQTLAGNPALEVDECIFMKDTSGGGFLCEGSTANTNEQLYRFPDADGADTTEYFMIDDTAIGSIDDASLEVNAGTLRRAALTGDVTASAGSNSTTIAANAVALTTDTTGNYVGDVTAGAGLNKTSSASEGQTVDLTVDSSEEDFLTAGALTCGASTQGKMQIHTTPLQYCDNAATPALQYAAYGTSDGDASAGDSATAFFDAGTIEHEYGGLEADVSAIATGGIFAGTASGTVGIVTIGTDGQVLTAQADGTAAWEAVAGSGDVTGVGDCASGACLDGTSDGGTYIRLYDGDSNYTEINNGDANQAADLKWVLPDTNGTAGQVLEIASVATNTLTLEWDDDGGAGSGAFSDASDPVVLNTTTKDVYIGDGHINTSKLAIGGDADQVQFTVQGHQTQTDDIVIVENNAGSELFTISPSPSIKLLEVADAPADTAGYGQIWVNTATPNELYFTDDAGTDFQLGAGGSDTNSVKTFVWPMAATLPLEAADSIPPITQDTGTNNDILAVSFNDSTDECRTVNFIVPTDVDTGGTVTFGLTWYSQTATTGNVIWDFRSAATGTEGEDWDQALTTDAAAADAVQGTVDLITRTEWTETVSNLGWAADDMITGVWCRDANAGGDTLSGDAEAITAYMEIPRA